MELDFMKKELDKLRLNEYRIVMLIAEYLHQASDVNPEYKRLEIPIDDMIRIIDIDKSGVKESALMQEVWREIGELDQHVYSHRNSTHYLCLKWFVFPSMNFRTKMFSLMVDKDMLQLYKDIRNDSCLPYDFVISKDAATLLKSMKYDRRYDKNYRCSVITAKPSLFKTRAVDWKEKRLQPAIVQIQEYAPVTTEILETHDDRALVKCDWMQQGVEVLEKEKQLYDCLPADLLNQHFPYHEQNMKMLEVLKQM